MGDRMIGPGASWKVAANDIGATVWHDGPAGETRLHLTPHEAVDLATRLLEAAGVDHVVDGLLVRRPKGPLEDGAVEFGTTKGLTLRMVMTWARLESLAALIRAALAEALRKAPPAGRA